MNKNEMLNLLNDDLKNEWTHMRFYLYHASAVTGLHCHEYKELFLKEAASEMSHVTEFSDVIRGLGAEAITDWHEIPKLSNPREIIQAALEMESQVVENYALRMQQASELGGVDGAWLEIFFEKQLEHSREDVDHFRQILRGL
jgi:bacterioferritin (cytochrome b1)